MQPFLGALKRKDVPQQPEGIAFRDAEHKDLDELDDVLDDVDALHDHDRHIERQDCRADRGTTGDGADRLMPAIWPVVASAMSRLPSCSLDWVMPCSNVISGLRTARSSLGPLERIASGGTHGNG